MSGAISLLPPVCHHSVDEQLWLYFCEQETGVKTEFLKYKSRRNRRTRKRRTVGQVQADSYTGLYNDDNKNKNKNKHQKSTE